MIQSPLDLSVFIQVTLKTQKNCRVYGDLLRFCWDLSDPELKDALGTFAAQYQWNVEIHETCRYGMVADFRERSEHSRFGPNSLVVKASD